VAALAEVFLRGRLDTSQLKGDAEKGLNNAGLGKLGEQHGKAFGQSFTASAGQMLAKVGVLLGALGVANVFKDSIAEAREAIKVGKLTEAAIKSTGGAAKISAKQIGDLANSLSLKVGVDDEAIQSGENLLLTFTNIRNGVGKSNDIFNQASAAVLDMTAAMNNGAVTTEGVKASSIQLGKALNDPIKGITALTRVGVTFSAEQKKQIEGFVKAGDTMSAQKVILAELSKEFGGAAAAAADPAQKAQVAWKNFEEMLGGLVLPVIGTLLTLLTGKVLPVIQNQIIPFVLLMGRAFIAAFREGDVTSTGLFGAIERLGGILGMLWHQVQAFWSGMTGGAKSAAGTMEQLGGVFHDVVIPALVTFAGWMETAVGWLTGGSNWAGLLRAAVAGAAGAILIAAGVIKIITTAQLLWNLAMSLNPIGLVILAIGALVAGLIYAWTHFSGFRDFLINAWKTISDATLWVWHNVFEPAFHGIAAVALWLWNNVLQPTFLGIKFYIENFVAPVVMFLWHNVVEPAFAGIRFAINVAWTVIQVIFAAIRLYVVTVLAPLFTWLWHNVVEPVFGGIAAYISAVWNNVIKPVFGALGGFIRDIVAPAFKAGVSAVEAQWNRIKDVAKVPVTFVVNQVINPMIRGFNKVASAFGVKSSVGEIGGFAAGGRIPGVASSRDNMLAAVATGEFIMPADKTARYLPVLQAMHSGSLPGYALGGLIDVGKDLVGAVTNPAKFIKGPIDAALALVPGGGTIRDMAVGAGRKLLDGLMTWIGGLFAGRSGGGGLPATGSLGQWIAAAMALTGVPASWAGPLNTLIMRESGGNPNAINLTDSNALAGHPSQGLMQTIPSTFAAYALPGLGGITNPVANIVAGIRYILSRYGSIFNVQQANANLPAKGYDQGGPWPSGTYGYNGSGRTEHVVTGPTMDAVVDRLDRLITAVERVAPGVGAEINRTGQSVIRLARAT